MATSRSYYKPYGDAFIVQTPHLDKFADRMWNLQQQREAEQKAESEKLDKAMTDEIGTMRNVDRDKYVELYNDYKTKKKRLLFDNKLQRNPKEYNQAQLEAEQSLARAKTWAAKSAEAKDAHTGLAKSYQQDPTKFSNDFSQRMEHLRSYDLDSLNKTPVGDVTDVSGFMYQGPGKALVETLQKSGGEKKPKFTIIKPHGTSGWEQSHTPVNSGNSPLEIKDFVMNAFVDERVQHDAERLWDKEVQNPEKVGQVIQAYNAITPEEWELKTGSPKPQKLDITGNMSKAEKYATLHAMKTFLSDAPTMGAEKIVPDQGKKREQEMKDKKSFALYQSGLAAGRIELAARLRAKGKTEDDDLSDDNDLLSIVNGYEEEAKDAAEAQGGEGSSVKYTIPDNKGEIKVVETYRMEPKPEVKELFTKEVLDRGAKVKVQPDEIAFGKDGNVYFTFYKKKDDDPSGGSVMTKDGKGYVIDQKLSGHITKKEFTQRIGKRIFGVAKTNKLMQGVKDKTPETKAPDKKETPEEKKARLKNKYLQ